MLHAQPISLAGLPSGTVCLTFDDGPGATAGGGPGPRTVELAGYLTAHDVPATFFVCGRHVTEHPGMVSDLLALGHAVGNHTHDHPDLVDHLAAGGDLGAELAVTDALIRAEGATGRLAFRPPYGSWSPEVAAALVAADPKLAARLVGPVLWDVDAQDWACWRSGTDPSEAAAAYVEAIEATGGGVVLLHDSTADDALLRAANRTVELVKVLLPTLSARGYRFAPLNEIPALDQLAQQNK